MLVAQANHSSAAGSAHIVDRQMKLLEDISWVLDDTDLQADVSLGMSDEYLYVGMFQNGKDVTKRCSIKHLDACGGTRSPAELEIIDHVEVGGAGVYLDKFALAPDHNLLFAAGVERRAGLAVAKLQLQLYS